MSDPCYWSAAQIASRLATRRISIAELTAAHLARIEAVNPALNAVVEAVPEAMETARALDAAGRPDDASPLWGAPVTVKINIDHAGYPNSNGVPAFAGAVADDDSPVVANLKRAGAVIVGRTNTPEFSLRWFTSNSLYGRTENPWGGGLTPGGSSGGAAASVVSGVGVVAHGNDLGGSLRYPAYCCGAATIRPSLGRIAAINPTQTKAGVERGPVTQMMSVQGPIARSVADVWAGLDVMRMRDVRDPSWTAALGRRATRGRLKVGLTVNPWGGPMDDAVGRALDVARRGLEAADCDVVDLDPPMAAEAPALWGRLLFAEAELLTAPAIEAHGSTAMRRYYRDFASLYDHADLPGFLAALQRRVVMQRAWAAMFEEVAALVAPVSLRRPFPNDLDFDDQTAVPGIVAAQAPLLTVNLLGLPAAALPTHVEAGVPLGVQIITAMHDDDLALDVAARLEREVGTVWQGLAG